MKKIVNSANATIASGASLSDGIDLGNSRAVRLGMPAAWTTAVITVQTSRDGVSYRNLYDKDGTEYTIQAAVDRSILLPIADFIGARFLKFRSGTAAAAVNQAAARSLEILAVPT